MKNQINEKKKPLKKNQDGQEEQPDPDIDALLGELKKHIIGVYDNIPNPRTDK